MGSQSVNESDDGERERELAPVQTGARPPATKGKGGREKVTRAEEEGGRRRRREEGGVVKDKKASW